MRLYGPSIGYASFAVVTRGFKQALSTLGILDGMIPVDAYDEWSGYPGALAKSAILCGPPDFLWWLMRKGRHERRAFMLAPNSSWVPPQILQTAAEQCTEILSPSRWGVGVLRANLDALGLDTPVSYVPHGVLPGFTARTGPPCGSPFTIAHLASTGLMRKSTIELVQGFLQWRMQSESRLRLVLAEESLSIMRDRISKAAGGSIPANIEIISRLNASPENLTRFYHSADLVCQPSRSEGFGLVPCECRVCGVPIALTNCTGHTDHVMPGDIIIEHGPDAWIDDGPRGPGQAEAPTVSPDAITDALEYAYVNCDEIGPECRKMAPYFASLYDWTAIVKQWATVFEGK